ncbi:peptidoglycan-binding protein [Kitasatospora xanthocidica]|uniref:peptidoglycan-binding protein n=1 Tax=Kitasatospora xanthocidica TaxID=83382 RepID=UPI0036E34782
MLNAAAASVGYKEGPNNDTVFGRWYGLNFNPWCDMAVSRWAADSGNADVVGHFAYCPSHVNFFRARGQWLGPNASVRRGDIVFYTWDHGPLADHVGVVTADSAPGENIQTIEGNTSSGSSGSQGNGDGCYRRTRSRTFVLGFGRPAYDAPSGSSLVPFPGAGFFHAGQSDDLITRMGERLVEEGCGRYSVGPGPDWGPADQRSYAAWQRELGYSGSDADGIPGESSWARLRVPND